ncbi:MAG: Gfo/Idh/MocA family oxidoreductase [Verrucomicrobia bacterium]|nr:Gfo/Idh/MocA family oxidoreductase [Verrucomicrobiota bacterium]
MNNRNVSSRPGNDNTLRSAQSTWSRRQFLRTTALAGAAAPFFVSCSTTQPGAKRVSANSKLNHACIGVGGMGWGDLQNFLQHQKAQVVALCDVDANNLDKAAKAVPGARTYADWREMLQKEGDRIDSVNVAVPDHTHFPASYSAIERGKHVYCQKPLCHDVAEVRVLTQAAIKRGVMTQLGTQIASTIHDRTAVQWLREGRIGKITHAYLCSNRPGAVKDYRLEGPRPAMGQEPPSSLDWNLWIGSAPMRPYAPDIYHQTKWRAWQDFGTGWSGDIGCHIFDAVWKGLGLHTPLTVWAEVQESWKDSPARRGDTWPQGDHIIWTFPGNEKIMGSELVLEWSDGEYYPPGGRVPGRREDRIPLRADRPDGGGHPARHRGRPGAGAKAPVGQPAPESHQLTRSQPLSPAQIPRWLAPGEVLINGVCYRVAVHEGSRVASAPGVDAQSPLRRVAATGGGILNLVTGRQHCHRAYRT